jgi:SAM-dependent MidA family methyltransferase
MQLALYHPDYGYYATNQSGQGIQSDFLTSAHLGSDFGELLAEQFAQLWQLLDRPHPFTLVEMGAGQGLLVQDVLRYLHRHHFECFAALTYLVVEQSPALVAAQQQRFQRLVQSGGRLKWCTWQEIPSDSIAGCFFSNELVDAFPVHRVAIANQQLQEIYIGLGPDSTSDYPFVERLGELSTPQLSQYFDLVGVQLSPDRYPEGYQTEVNLAALDWMATVADRLQQGYVLSIDYGYPAERYYSPRRSQGTLQCYFQHAHHSDPYRAVGRQDITAHVDFTALERQGEKCGLETLGWSPQTMFLMALGLGDRIAALSYADPDQPLPEILRRREALHALMDPMGLGNFGVLVQGKNLTTEQRSLKGLTVPG